MATTAAPDVELVARARAAQEQWAGRTHEERAAVLGEAVRVTRRRADAFWQKPERKKADRELGVFIHHAKAANRSILSFVNLILWLFI